MAELGFALLQERTGDLNNSWRWKIERGSEGPFEVWLIQWHDVNSLGSDGIAYGLLPTKGMSNAPRLRRVAAISAPVVGMDGEPIAEILNEKVGDAISMARAC